MGKNAIEKIKSKFGNMVYQAQYKPKKVVND
jgi:hypothetical protein